MIKISRRMLARYAADRLLDGVAATKLGDQLAAVLHQQKMQGQAELLAADINYELEARRELAVSRATTAHPLDAEATADVERAIKRATGVKAVSLETEIDKSLIGGVRIETATQSWDESLKHKLANLRGVV